MFFAKGCHATIAQGSSKTDVLAVFCCGQTLTKQTAKKRLKAVLRVLCLVLNLEVRGQYKELLQWGHCAVEMTTVPFFGLLVPVI